jgi:hypothetical protein
MTFAWSQFSKNCGPPPPPRFVTSWLRQAAARVGIGVGVLFRLSEAERVESQPSP